MITSPDSVIQSASPAPPRVSVMVITYNHERFIGRAIESAVTQKTNFAYEIVVGEDCSTDRTREILIAYRKRFPEKIRLLLNERNLGASRNARQVSEVCRGEYLALLEGDDRWTSADKLQHQVDFLDAHPECAVCFHNARVVCLAGEYPHEIYCRPDQKEFTTAEDLLKRGNYIPTCSVMYRRGLYANIPEWVSSLKMGDWPLHVLNALKGDIGYIDEIMAEYVVHEGGAWFRRRQNAQEVRDANIQFYDKFYRHLGRRYRRIIQPILCGLYHEAALDSLNGGDPIKARAYARRWAKRPAFINLQLLKLLVFLHLPSAYGYVKSGLAGFRTIGQKAGSAAGDRGVR